MKEKAKSKTKKSSLLFSIKEIDGQENVLRFIGSNEEPDRHGDVVVAAGWELDNYKKNPVFLWGHDYSALPIGKAVNVFVDNMKNALIFDIEFAVNEYPLAETVYKLYKGKYLNAVSVGFIVKDWHIEDEDTFYLDKNELLELSAVTVPANPSALLAGIQKGVFSAEEAKELKKYMDYKPTLETKEVDEPKVEDEKPLSEEEAQMEKTKIVVELELDTTEAEKKIKSLFDMVKETTAEIEAISKDVEAEADAEEEVVEEEVVEEVPAEEEPAEEIIEEKPEEKDVEEADAEVVEAEEVVEDEKPEEEAAEEKVEEEVLESEEEVKDEVVQEEVEDEKSLTEGLIDSVRKILKEETK